MRQVALPLPGGIVEVLVTSDTGLVERAGKYMGEVELSALGEPIGFVELFAPGDLRAPWSPRRRDEEARAKAALYEQLAIEADLGREKPAGELDVSDPVPSEVEPDDEMAKVTSVDAGAFFDHEERHLAHLVHGYSEGLSRRRRHMYELAGLGALCLGGFIAALGFLVGKTTPLDTLASLVPSACGGALFASAELRLFSKEDKASRMRMRLEEARVVEDRARVSKRRHALYEGTPGKLCGCHEVSRRGSWCGGLREQS